MRCPRCWSKYKIDVQMTFDKNAVPVTCTCPECDYSLIFP